MPDIPFAGGLGVKLVEDDPLLFSNFGYMCLTPLELENFKVGVTHPNYFFEKIDCCLYHDFEEFTGNPI